ncbi:trypsin-like peptidase domain-containing protein [Streptomyces sp. NPDC002018]|uniref:nSTAND1 domain-containing NTPase n=1 Tax=Streptomyces sp. NPDC002018 TaxID=3364629 RepID=UPI0036A44D11
MDFDSTAPGDAAVARILDSNGRPVGAGFLAGRYDVLTCAHVVANALGVPPDAEEIPSGRLQLDFPLARPGREVEARVGAWAPMRADRSGDVAVLRLLSEPPAKAPVARLVDDVAGPDRRVRTFGFPAGYDDGVWSVGWLRGRQGADWFQYDTDPAAQHRVQLGFSGAPVWDTDGGGVIGMVVAADRGTGIRTAYLIPTGTLRESWPALGEASLGASPFRALDHFHERDAVLFHGRKDPAHRIVDRLGYAPATCLVGPSGSGKSSLLFAGVLPLLRENTYGGPHPQTVVLRPGRPGPSPLTTLAHTLLPLLEPDLTETARLEERPRLERLLRTGEMPAVVDRLLTRQGKDKLLVVADQFEEALVGAAQADLVPFADALKHCLEPGSRLQVLLGLRADFLTAALDHQGLAPLLAGDRLFTLGAMSDTELRAAIIRPLEGTGVSYEPGLVDRILGDIGHDPGRLPLLQFTLTRLWERQQRGVIGHTAYESLGRVDDSLANYAEQVWTAGLTGDEQQEARALLTQLVHPADGRAAPARRTVRRSELHPARWRIAQRLMTTRLVVPGEDHLPDDGPPEETVELAHETLLTQWTRLREFVTADHEFRAWQEDLRRRAAHWERTRRSRRRLLRGADLRDAYRWQRRRPSELSSAETEFINASSRAGRRRLGLAAAVTAFLVTGTAVLVMTGWGADPSPQLSENASRELWRQAATEADDISGNRYTALLLAMRAYRTQDTPRTRALLGQMHERYAFADLLVPNYQEGWNNLIDGWEPSSSIARQGEVIASQKGDGKGAVWQYDGSGFSHRSTGRSGNVNGVSSDGSLVAFTAASARSSLAGEEPDPGVYLYDVRTGKTRPMDVPDVRFFQPSYQRLAVDPAGKRLVGENDDGDLYVWNAVDGDFQKGVPFPADVLLGLRGDGAVTWSSSSTPSPSSESERVWKYSIALWDLDGVSLKPRKTHTFQYTDVDTRNGLRFDVSPDLSRLAVVEYTRPDSSDGSDGTDIDATVYELSSGDVEWHDQFTADHSPDHITIGDQDPPTLLYEQSEGLVQLTPVRGAKADTISVAPIWDTVDLLGMEGDASLALHARGLIALVGPHSNDPTGRLPEEAEDFTTSPPPAPDADKEPEERRQAKEWMADLCHILGDEQLPQATEKDLPPGAYEGRLCP